MSISATDVLSELKAGNARFKEGRSSAKPWQSAHSASPQNPIAILVGCSDSRVPVEIVFDQGPGDLFVVRVAGNVVAPSQIGSVEFAATQFQTPLVIVMGHTGCGAIDATIKFLQNDPDQLPGHLGAITERIAPGIKNLVQGAPVGMPEALGDACMRANVSASVDQLKGGSTVLEELTTKGDLLICGAYYDLQSGQVHFLD